MGKAIEEIEQELGVLFRRGRALSHELAESVHPGLEPGHYAFLVRLEETGPSRPSELAAFFHIGKATAGRQLTCLETLGLVTRRPDPEDGRAHLLELTPEGVARVVAARARRREMFHDRLSTWPEGDLSALAQLLARFNTEFS
ncbi:MarR family winged helix-turn-helix transcriptional regulator [Streptacidiphilus jiangxiensis]|uniref:DNA-binding transcriptional regulator, MarR family n=1 Tax=Streptacidiphilus jiangxiensis TaxID=235985 RepID=A0A1H7VH24_STRJI|nr:MarR family transcriptional regulator [Streptacidiphilus jiangxiensis]SEM08128.1 DNA-binding transcriptional regulator, MarR family [Streptacidiphilus jiangxiensis]